MTRCEFSLMMTRMQSSPQAKKEGRRQGPSLQDVARKAGVAPSTVSLVLNNRPNVADGTRQSVLAAVEKLNYVPLTSGRPRGSRVDDSRTHQVAVVVAGKTRAMLKSPVYTEVLHGVESALAASEQTMQVRFVCHDELGNTPLLNSKVDGILLLGEMDEATVRREFRHLPVVHFMGSRSYDNVYDHVTYDDSRIGELAAEHLLQAGHRHALTVISQDAGGIWERSRNFSRHFIAGGGQVLELTSERLLISTDECNEAGWGAMRRSTEVLLEADPRPTAAFLPLDTLLPPFYGALRELGIEPGTDIEVVGCNNERPYLDSLQPRPATIDIHAELVGARAVEQLLWRLDHPNASQTSIQLAPSLVPGATISNPTSKGVSA